MQLRALLPEVGMPSIPTILALPKAQDLFDEEGEPKADWVGLQAKRFLDELEWYAEALRAARARAYRTGASHRFRLMSRYSNRSKGVSFLNKSYSTTPQKVSSLLGGAFLLTSKEGKTPHPGRGAALRKTSTLTSRRRGRRPVPAALVRPALRPAPRAARPGSAG